MKKPQFFHHRINKQKRATFEIVEFSLTGDHKNKHGNKLSLDKREHEIS